MVVICDSQLESQIAIAFFAKRAIWGAKVRRERGHKQKSCLGIRQIKPPSLGPLNFAVLGPLAAPKLLMLGV